MAVPYSFPAATSATPAPARVHDSARLAVAIATGIYVASTIFRFWYVLISHHPRHHVYTDVAQLLSLAERLATEPRAQTIGDTIWPPGTSALLALLLSADPTLGLAALVNAIAGAAVPLLVAQTVSMVMDRRAGAHALALASLHFGFIHYGGFFLSEQYFQVAVALGIWCAVVALTRPAGGARLERLALGAGVGVIWALAASIRPTALPVALGAGLALAAQAAASRQTERLELVGFGAVAFVLGITPLAWRCSALVGAGFCPISTNFAMNVALGQAGEVAGLAFEAAGRSDLSSSWVPPALLHHGFSGMRTVPTSIYDTGGVVRWVWGELMANPGAFVMRAIGNALDLFRFEQWPDDEAPGARVAKQAFFLAVVVPGLLGFGQVARRTLRDRTAPAPVAFLLAALLAVIGMAALSLGEARYRIPFDGVLILFALAFWRGPGALLSARPARSLDRRAPIAFHAVALSAAFVLGTVAIVAWPGRRGASAMDPERAARAARTAEAAPFSEESAAELLAAKPAGSAWDAPGNYRFRCTPGCSELRLTFSEPQAQPGIEVSLDNNDRYRVALYRRGVALAVIDLPFARLGQGLQLQTISVPPSALPYDVIGIRPLYGDGYYAVGHARPVPLPR